MKGSFGQKEICSNVKKLECRNIMECIGEDLDVKCSYTFSEVKTLKYEFQVSHISGVMT